MAFVELVGYTSSFLSTSYTDTTITGGNTYRFRIKAKNKYGWGPESDILSVIAAAVPSTPAAVTTTVSGTNVIIDWTAPSANG